MEKISADEACAILGISRPTLWRRVKAGEITAYSEQGKTNKVQTFNKEEIEKIAGVIKVQPSYPTPTMDRIKTWRKEQALAIQQEMGLEKEKEPVEKPSIVPSVPIWKKLFLTLDEAVAYTGISRDALINIVCYETKIGVKNEYGRGWRFNRKKLEEWLER